MSPVKGDEDDEATRASFIQGEVERAGTVQPRQKAQEGLTNVYKCLLKENFVERARLFSVVPTDRTRGNGHKLKTVKLNTRKHFFTVRVTEHWNRSPRFVLEPPSLIIFKT